MKEPAGPFAMQQSLTDGFLKSMQSPIFSMHLATICIPDDLCSTTLRIMNKCRSDGAEFGFVYFDSSTLFFSPHIIHGAR
jgi:hypothetical protein